jgi:hypothetical protein
MSSVGGKGGGVKIIVPKYDIRGYTWQALYSSHTIIDR